MTSRRQRKLNRESSLLGLLRQAQAQRAAEAAMTSPLDAARWSPDGYAYSPWDRVLLSADAARDAGAACTDAGPLDDVAPEAPTRTW